MKYVGRGLKWYIVFAIWIASSTALYAQIALPKARFVASKQQRYGFDAFQIAQWRTDYTSIQFRDSLTQPIPYKSVWRESADVVNLYLRNGTDSLKDLRFEINAQPVKLNYLVLSKDTIQLTLPASDSSFLLNVFKRDLLETALQVVVYQPLQFNLRIVPLAGSIRLDSLGDYLNAIYGQAGVRVNVQLDKRYKPQREMDSIFANPSADHDRYTEQMMAIRDDYFAQFGTEEDTYYLFLISGFVSPEVSGYMVRNKGVAFIKYNGADVYYEISRQLGFGVGQLQYTWKGDGPARGTTQNLMDDNGTHLTHRQWESIRSSVGTISYYDDFEGVRANNGIISYYLWEEDENGMIAVHDNNLLGALRRPFKRNTYSLYLNIDNILFVQLFDLWIYPICLLHILSLFVVLLSAYWVRRIVRRRFDFLRQKWYIRWSTRIGSMVIHGALFWGFFLAINEGYYMFEVHDGEVESLKKTSISLATRELWTNQNTRRSAEQHIGSEVLIKRGDQWFLDKRKPVLYFNVRSKNGKRTLQFYDDTDVLRLQTLRYRKEVKTHYFVFRYLDEEGVLQEEKVFNHLGLDITDKLFLDDPADRVVLFINGYRPTSLGGSFEDNFSDIQKNGLEFPNSSNVILENDERYEYWKWNKINERFTRRLNPTAVYYADGHHSVATSNHETLVDFTRHSLKYPKRCKNKNHHVCLTTKRGWKWLGLQREVPTYETMPLEPNEDGFELRRENGRIAGRNFLQLLNEIPRKSDNDTLFLVAHSMGYAYALGILDEMRERVNLGGFYIIAPENATSGEVEESEWQEIWQYGSDFEAHKEVAPCLLDGIAPQSKVKGLSPRKRVYIPEQFYTRMGFFDSHFVGHYTWIFDIPPGEPGHIRQR
jgi:hypothetical protein